MRFLFIIIALLILPPHVAFALTAAGEYEVKAVYLFNLGNFVKWKEDVLTKNFEICLFGADPFGVNLDYVVEKEKQIQSYNVVIKQLSGLEGILNCQVLFMSRSAQPQFITVFAAIKNKPVLTVSDADNFVTQGGMVQFYSLEGKIRLMLDPETIEDSGLKASSQLMKIARIIEK